MRHITLSLLALPLSLLAQTPLPYSTGFDNASQQAGWQQFRTGHLSTYDWGISSFGAPSAPNMLYHDYPVGGNPNDTVRDWWVSPLLDLSAAASLTLKINVYSITGNTFPSDGLSIMLLTGSANPALATVTPLQDLLPLATSSSTFTQLPAVYIPASGPAYIAFYYQATQNWLTPGIDDVIITQAGVGVEENGLAEAMVSLWPNPSTGDFNVAVEGVYPNQGSLALQVHNACGALVLTRSLRTTVQVDTDLPEGYYAYAIIDDRSNVIGRGRLVVAR